MWVPAFWVSVAVNLEPMSPTPGAQITKAFKVVGKCTLCGTKVERALTGPNHWQRLDEIITEVARELIVSHVPQLPIDPQQH